MDKWLKRTMHFASGLALTAASDPSVIPYKPGKTEVLSEEQRYFKRSSPEEVGLSSGRLLSFLSEIEANKNIHLHNLLVVKGKCVVLECSHPGYGTTLPHLAHSMSKVLTSLAIGILIDDGLLRLCDKVIDFFPEYTARDKRFSDMTVEHLLTMSSGVRFNEAGVVSEVEWTRAFVEGALGFAPGERFEYNSMNTYVLAHIAVRRLGRSLSDFVRERLLSPLGITSFFWELSPEGIEKGGFGVFMSAEGWARLGMLVLGGGVFEGRRLISSTYIRRATTAWKSTPDSSGEFDYGYQIWVARKGGGLLFSGMLGQCVYVSSRNGIVIVANSGSNELYQAGGLVPLIEKFFGADLSYDLSYSPYSGSAEELSRACSRFYERRRWVRPYHRVRDFSGTLGTVGRSPYPVEWDSLLGSYDFAENNLSLLPVFIRSMQNNFGAGIDRITFLREDERIFVEFAERGGPYRIEIGFSDFAQTVLNIRGESYIVRAIGEATEDLDRDVVFKLELVFPEMPNSRRILIRRTSPGRLDMTFSEQPNEGLGSVFADEVLSTNGKLSFFVNMLDGRMGASFFSHRVRETFTRTVFAAKRGTFEYASVLSAAHDERRSYRKSHAVIEAIVNRFIAESEDGEEEQGIREKLGSAVNRLRERLGAATDKTEPVEKIKKD